MTLDVLTGTPLLDTALLPMVSVSAGVLVAVWIRERKARRSSMQALVASSDPRAREIFLRLHLDGEVAGMARLRRAPVFLSTPWRPWRQPTVEWWWDVDYVLGEHPDDVWHREDLILGSDVEAAWLVDPRRREPQELETREGPTRAYRLTECSPTEVSENRRWFEVDGR
ncbi:MAG: hypothetical protein NTV28_04275 [Propionibacteriales bacterium]|nr:hypothetical protein [Propionibacteriales bacterium]